MSALVDSLSSATTTLNISNPSPIMRQVNDLSEVQLTDEEVRNFLDGYFDYPEEMDDPTLSDEQKKEMEKKFIIAALDGYSQFDTDELFGEEKEKHEKEQKTEVDKRLENISKLQTEIAQLEEISLYNPVAMTRFMRSSLRLKKQLLHKYQNFKRQKLN
jgi:hypothetical protein